MGMRGSKKKKKMGMVISDVSDKRGFVNKT